MSIIEDLERLAQLRERGILSEEEFQQEKKKILDQRDADRSLQGRGSVTPSAPTIELPPQPEIQHRREANQQKPSKGTAKTMVLSATVIIGVIIAIRMIASVAGDPASGRGERLHQLAVMSPDPVVTQQNVDDSESSIWDVSRTLTGKVRNKGGDGYVLIKGCLQQGGKYFERQERRYLNREEECSVKYTFDEVTAGGGDMRAWIEVYQAQ